ncbi:MAG TPA: PEP-CTERM sorting domain-containing protein [Pirellulales bacterium]|nr:PEP-CTERM sorting domain-containing protein [Pirellulales bacterium]
MVGTHVLAPNTSNQAVALTLTDDGTGGAMYNIILNVVTGQGGPDGPLGPGAGNIDGPIIIGADMIDGGLFGAAGGAGNSYKPSGGQYGYNPAQPVVTFDSSGFGTTNDPLSTSVEFGDEQWWAVQQLTTGTPLPNTTTGTVVTLLFSTVGVAPGTYTLTLDPTLPGFGEQPSVWGDGTNVNNLTTVSGLLVVTPEPSSIVMGLFAAAGLCAVAIRKRRARA